MDNDLKLPVKVQIEYKRGDMKAAANEEAKITSDHRMKNRRKWASLLVLLSAIILLRYWMSGTETIAPTILVEALTIAAYMMISGSGAINAAWAGIWEFEFFDAHVRHRRSEVEIILPWTFFEGFSETEKHLFLWSRDHSTFIIPKSAFKSPEELIQLMDLVKAKLNPLKKKSRFQFSLMDAVILMAIAGVAVGGGVWLYQQSEMRRVAEEHEVERVRSAIIDQLLQNDPETAKDLKEADVSFDRRSNLYRIGVWRVDPSEKLIRFVGPSGQMTARYRILHDIVEFYEVRHLRATR